MRSVEFENGKKVIKEWPVPDVSPLQMRRALKAKNWLTKVNLIAATDDEAEMEWEYAVVIQRNSPVIERLKSNEIRTFTDQEIDDLFWAASRL